MPTDDDIPFIDRTRLRWKVNEQSLLGEGSFGFVYRGTWDGTDVAIKIVKRPEVPNASEEYRNQEAAAMRQHCREIHRFGVVQGPHIIQYLGVFRDVDPRDLYIVTEFLAGGSLYDSLCEMRQRNAFLQERSFLIIARHIANGLNHVHSEHFTHGDMKPQNVLLTSAFQFDKRSDGVVEATFPEFGKVKIADFGLSKRLEGAKPSTASLNATTDFGTGPCGTYLYMAPEAYAGVAQLPDEDVKAADIYAYGMVLFELLSGLSSWELEHVRNIWQLQTMVRVERRWPAWGTRETDIRPPYRRLVERCWSYDTCNRPTADEIVQTLEELQTQLTRVEVLPPQATVRVCGSEENGEHGMLNGACSARVFPASSVGETSDGGITIGPERNGDKDFPEADAVDIVRRVESMRILTDSQTDDVRGLGLGILHLGNGLNEGEAGSEYESQFAASRQHDSDVLYEDDNYGLLQKVDSKGEVIKGEEEEEGPAILRKRGSAVGLRTGHIQDGKRCDESAGGEASSSDDRGSGEELHLGRIQTVDGWGLPAATGELEDSIVGVPLTRVQSMNVPRPTEEKVECLPELEGRGVHGSGSIAANGNVPHVPNRPKVAILESFCNAAQGDSALLPSDLHPSPFVQDVPPLEDPTFGLSIVHADVVRDFAVGQQFAQGVEVESSSGFVPAEVRVQPALSDDTLEHENRQQSYFCASDEALYFDPHELNRTSFDPDLASTAQRADVMIPQDLYAQLSQGTGFCNSVQIPVNTIVCRPPELTGTYVAEHSGNVYNSPQEPAQQLNAYRSLTAASATAPPLTNTEQSVPTVTPTVSGTLHCASHATLHAAPHAAPHATLHATLRGSQQNTPHAGPHDVKSVLDALRGSNAPPKLDRMWQNGHMRSVANGLSKADWLEGEELFKLCVMYLKQNNGHDADRRDASIAKDLCIAIGKIARKDSRKISSGAVLLALPVTLSSMFSFQGQGDVFAACNFGLSNLLKVYNTIKNDNLRTELAAWISYSISWNLYNDGVRNGPHVDTLAYLGASAARNFMWLNETNVKAFVAQRYGNTQAGTTGLMESLRYFDSQHNVAVVEASLSALSMIVNVPAQRRAFMRLHGTRLFKDVLQRHSHRVAIVTLVQSMITLLMAGRVPAWPT